MSTPDITARLEELLTSFKLPTMASECARRFSDAGHDDALDVLLETLEAELGERRIRRCDRLLRASKLPPGKTFENVDEQRLPKGVVPRLREQKGPGDRHARREVPGRTSVRRVRPRSHYGNLTRTTAPRFARDVRELVASRLDQNGGKHGIH